MGSTGSEVFRCAIVCLDSQSCGAGNGRFCSSLYSVIIGFTEEENGKMSDKQYRAAAIGLTGKGNWGHGLHLGLKNHQRVTVVAVADEDEGERFRSIGKFETWRVKDMKKANGHRFSTIANEGHEDMEP